MDMITIYLAGNDNLEALVSEKKQMLLTDVMATDVVTGQMDSYSKEWDINGETVTIGVKKNQ